MSEFDGIRRILLQRCEDILNAELYMPALQRQAWTTYRNALQDLDTTVENPIFPQAPEEPTLPLTSQQTAKRAEIAGYLQIIAAQYQNAIDRLVEIETAGAVPFTQAGFNQVVQAMKDEAKYIRQIAQALKRYLT